MIIIDGSAGEGGGQIIRTSLGLALLTGQAVQLINVRAKRSRPGLQRQHVMAVLAAAEIGQAKIAGAEVGSQKIFFTPGQVTPGDYAFDIGSAGSTTLVLQTVLPALIAGNTGSRLVIEGGTHNSLAPTTGFLAQAFAPLLARFGPQLSVQAQPFGFYPAGGGKLTATIEPTAKLQPVDLLKRGAIVRRRAVAYCSHLPAAIGDRELKSVSERLGWTSENSEVETIVLTDTRGPGNVLELTIESEHVTEVIVAFGERGKPAEVVAKEAAAEADAYLQAEAPVGMHLADQLLIPLALAGSGSFVTLPLSLHTTTNMRTIERFLPVKFTHRERSPGQWLVEVHPA